MSQSKDTVGVCPGLNESFSLKLQAGKHKPNRLQEKFTTPPDIQIIYDDMIFL